MDLPKVLVRKIAEQYAPVYRQLNWTWVGIGGDGIPDADDLEQMIHSLARDVDTEEAVSVGSGGFQVGYEDSGSEDRRLASHGNLVPFIRFRQQWYLDDNDDV